VPRPAFAGKGFYSTMLEFIERWPNVIRQREVGLPMADHPMIIGLAVAPAAVEALPMLPVGMAVPIAAAGVEYAKRRSCQHRTAPVWTTVTMRPGMESPAAAACGISR
jgi:hypothetical protein